MRVVAKKVGSGANNGQTQKRHRFLLESTPKQLIQITDEYIYSDFGQIVPLI
ncbi:hypothetical protein [Bacillus thuringiensis]|uniref:hypothetical protein n=1 Tax=Bacillus thuringiensis TaxID=1428 RepID=UPI0011ADAA9A|nr:hypothetical protein FHX98_6687 [Bacillus sp. AK8]